VNRESRRKAARYIRRKSNLSVAQVDEMVHLLDDVSGGKAPVIQDGDRVKLNVDKIVSRKTYNDLNEQYRNFVEVSSDKVFTAKNVSAHKNIVSLVEAPKWYFWAGDLIRVE